LGAGLGEKTFTDDYMLYHKGGFVNFPRKGHGIWYMRQYVRFGYLKEAPDYQAIADKLIMQDLYKEVASELKIPIPDDDMKPFTIKLDNVTFDPANPMAAYRSPARVF
jgi:nitrate/nitrite transport system substrate-binding protein